MTVSHHNIFRHSSTEAQPRQHQPRHRLLPKRPCSQVVGLQRFVFSAGKVSAVVWPNTVLCASPTSSVGGACLSLSVKAPTWPVCDNRQTKKLSGFNLESGIS